FDVESVADGALLARTLYPGEGLSPDEAIRRYREEHAKDQDPADVFIPVTFHVPVAVAVARVSEEYRLLDMTALDAPRFDPQTIVESFWRGVQHYHRSVLVDFNGRSFDLPLLTFSAYR